MFKGCLVKCPGSNVSFIRTRSQFKLYYSHLIAVSFPLRTVLKMPATLA